MGPKQIETFSSDACA